MVARRRSRKPISSNDAKPVSPKPAPSAPFTPDRRISVSVSRTVQGEDGGFMKVGFMQTENIKDSADFDEAYDTLYDTLLAKVEDKLAEYEPAELEEFEEQDEPEEPEGDEPEGDEPEGEEPEMEEITEEEIDEMTKKELIQFIKDEDLEVPTNQKIKELREAIKDEIFGEPEYEGEEGSEEWGDDDNWGDD